MVISVDEAELQRFIDACSHADAVGPFLDPTAWMRGHENLTAIAESARAARVPPRTCTAGRPMSGSWIDIDADLVIVLRVPERK